MMSRLNGNQMAVGMLKQSFVIVALLAICCRAKLLCVADPRGNDLAALLGQQVAGHYETMDAALADARPGDALMVMAQGYPSDTVNITSTQWSRCAALSLRMYVEFAQLTIEAPLAQTQWERVVASDTKMPGLDFLDLLHPHKNIVYINATTTLGLNNTLLVLARVAGYDNAVDGLPGEPGRVIPLLTHMELLPNLTVLWAATPLSNCVTRRFMPSTRWMAVWTHILRALVGAGAAPVTWQPTVVPAYTPGEQLPPAAERVAFINAVQWYKDAVVLPTAERVALLSQGIDTIPNGTKSSNGQLGVLEGFSSDMNLDGSQPQVLI